MIQPDERETIITYNEGSDIAVIYTFDRALQIHIEMVLKVKASMKYGKAREYSIPKRWLQYPKNGRHLKSPKRAQIA